MHGDELMALLGGYVSNLERAIVNDDLAVQDRLSSLAAHFSGYNAAPGDVGEANSAVGRLLSGTTSTATRGSDVAEELIDAMAASVAAMKRGWSAQGGRAFASLPDVLMNGDRYPVDAATNAGGRPISAGIAAVLDAFRGGNTQIVSGELERQRYIWQSASHSVEGLVGKDSHAAGLDSAFDGSLRAIEQKHRAPNRIDVRIEALDARSFLDRKEDIAEAVRQAMLTSGALGAALNEY